MAPVSGLGALMKAQALFGWLSLPGRFHAGILAKAANVDGALIDMQHGLHDFRDVIELIDVLHQAGKPALLRAAVGDYGMLGRLADAAADGIVMPMVENAAMAAECVAQIKYPPLGGRSWGPYLALAHAGISGAEYLQSANEHVKFLPMIETRKAYEALDEIMAVPGVDGIFVGPTDLSISLSEGRSADVFQPEAFAIASDIAQRCASRGMACGVYAGSGEAARKLLAAGFSFVTLGNDASMMAAGVADSFAAARGA